MSEPSLHAEPSVQKRASIPAHSQLARAVLRVLVCVFAVSAGAAQDNSCFGLSIKRSRFSANTALLIGGAVYIWGVPALTRTAAAAACLLTPVAGRRRDHSGRVPQAVH